MSCARARWSSLDDSLLEAIRRMGIHGAAALPVTDGDGELAGLITRSHILNAYELRVARNAATTEPQHS